MIRYKITEKYGSERKVNPYFRGEKWAVCNFVSRYSPDTVRRGIHIHADKLLNATLRAHKKSLNVL